MQSLQRFQRASAVVLVATLGVILWGAYVRASGSGAGCGSHWPTCNGEVVPRARSVATIIEFTHRATSGLVFLLILGQTIWAWRALPRGHEGRRWATLGFLFIVTEALVGAGLVLFEMVAGNKSIARAFWMAAHLMNTFALLAALSLTWLSAREGRRQSPRPTLPASWRLALGAGMAAVLVVAISGSVVALGDTLFPSRSLAEGLARDFAPGEHPFLRLRFLHPILAAASALYLLVVAALVAARDSSGALRTQATVLGALVLSQVAVGVLNLGLLAPTALQIIHLLMADLVWIALVCLARTAWPLAAQPAVTAVDAPAAA